MATSGTTSTTIFSNQALIDQAGRNAGLTPQQITGEHVQTALTCLYLSLSKLANKGQPLWRLAKIILPMYQLKQTVQCPLGVVDVRNLNLRQLQRQSGTYSASEGDADNAFDGEIDTACIQTIADGWIQAEFESETYLTNFGILPGASGTWSYELQASDDGATWTTFYAAEATVVDGEWLWIDLEGVPQLSFCRLQAADGTILDVRELVMANTPNEIPLALINMDDYFNLPDKTFQGRPTQYFLQKLRERQVLNLWPAPGYEYTFYQLTAQVYLYPEDVGSMTDELDVPQRWYDCLVDDLSVRLCKQFKEADRSRLPDLKQDAAASWNDAWSGESDRAPTYLSPRISPYTK